MIPSDKYTYVKEFKKGYFKLYITNEMMRFMDVGLYNNLYIYHDNTYLYLTKKPTDKDELDRIHKLNFKEISIFIDGLGDKSFAVNIPARIVSSFGGFYEGQKLYIKYYDKTIAFKSFQNQCLICKSHTDLLVYGGVYLCRHCHSRFT